ncbi:transposase [Streptomyces tubercidicus]|uniref:transposase n=1 Tax=Streptomyces tubercidicus TaxID=47759 RepID=UPI0036BD3B1B
MAAVVTAGQRGDAPVFTEITDRIRVPRTGNGYPRTRSARVLGDQAYSSRKIREYLRRRQIPHTIPEKRDQAGHRLRRGSAGGPVTRLRPRNVQAQAQGRMLIGLSKQAGGVATRYDKLAVRYEVTFQLTLLRPWLRIPGTVICASAASRAAPSARARRHRSVITVSTRLLKLRLPAGA